MNLFKFKIFKSVFANKGFPLIIQLLTLAVFILLILGAWGVSAADPVFLKTLRNTNLSNLIVWSYWWPIIIITAIVLGRYWCTICPMELITTIMSKIGFRKKTPPFLKTGWLITVFYAVVVIIGIHTLAIHRVPHRMAVYMMTLFALAVLAGLIWEKRAFCSHICPVGHLLGFYALLSTNEWRVKDPGVCQTCGTKDCIAKDRLYRISGRSCTSGLYPAKINDNRKCILCTQCMKACPNDNLAIKIRRPFADLFLHPSLTFAEIAFAGILSGFVVYEILSEWTVSKKILMKIPEFTNGAFSISGIFSGTTTAVILFVIFPAFFFAAFGLLKKRFGEVKLKDALSAIVVGILPIMAGMHILKALLKTVSRIPYWPFVFNDPKGIETARLLLSGSYKIDQSAVLFWAPVLSGIAVILPLVMLAVSVFIVLKNKTENNIQKGFTLLAVCIYFAVFEAAIIGWRLF